MEVKIIILYFLLVGIVAGFGYIVYDLKKRCDKLERQDWKIENDIHGLDFEVNLLKKADNLRKESELMAERKQKMADYLTMHPRDPITDLAGVLYDIANGQIIKEENNGRE